MDAVIYVFSGTGNTLVLARELARLCGARVVPIAQCTGQGVRPDAPLVGIVFPTYFSDLPPIVEEFARSLRGLEGSFLFAVATYGGGAGDSFRSLQAALSGNGARLDAWFGIHMQQNAFRKPWEKYNAIEKIAFKKAGVIARRVTRRIPGTAFGGRIKDMLLGLLRERFRLAYRRSLSALSGLPEGSPPADLLRGSDRSYSVTENCDGCGLCARTCPVRNIRMEGGRPVWGGRCEACLACRSWCPHRAIAGGVAKAGYFYTNPRVTAADIGAQRPDGH
jgi:ferredoxin